MLAAVRRRVLHSVLLLVDLVEYHMAAWVVVVVNGVSHGIIQHVLVPVSGANEEKLVPAL